MINCHRMVGSPNRVTARLPPSGGKSYFEHRIFEIWGFRLDHLPCINFFFF